MHPDRSIISIFLGLLLASQPLQTSAWMSGRSAARTRDHSPKRHSSVTTALPPIDVASSLYSFQTGVADSLSPTSGVLVYGVGLLSAASPCSVAMLPLTVAYLSAEARSSQPDDDLSDAAPPRNDLFALSICFALGLSVALAAIGVSAALAGQVFGSFFSNSGQVLRLASGSFAAVGGLSLLEIIDIEMPSFGASSSLGNQADKGAASSTNLERFSRSFAFGASSALVSSTCSTPILASLLGNVASSSDSALGAALLFCYTAGLATPIVAASALGVGATLGAKGERLSEISTPVLASFLIAYGVYSGLDAVFVA